MRSEQQQRHKQDLFKTFFFYFTRDYPSLFFPLTFLALTFLEHHSSLATCANSTKYFIISFAGERKKQKQKPTLYSARKVLHNRIEAQICKSTASISSFYIIVLSRNRVFLGITTLAMISSSHKNRRYAGTQVQKCVRFSLHNNSENL